MSRVCEITKKRFGKGKTYNYRGIAKYKGGIGLNITGSCKRQHRINLMEQKLWSPEQKRWIKLKLTAHALRIIDKVGIDEVLRREKRKEAMKKKVAKKAG
ncbi:MAG: 50S ribosomal protein L28 [Chlamydiia bacterium]|nr:50S ribosomal protein L28 [Chlamydiia bacterium]MCH9618850.1 50S ribosomal protein L28 [Chlamydiia bacterium]MCH9624549.1 50S ribosomal protein L28 [Chlamydiia bacterium]